MQLIRVFATILVLASTVVAAQDKAGPMQSGRHVQSEGNKPAAGSTAGPQAAAPAGAFDVPQLFATSCGWCHLNGGRVAGKGPKLMGTDMTDAQIVSRIVNGKTGAMPAFGSTFSGEQLKAIVDYIRNLKAS